MDPDVDKHYKQKYFPPSGTGVATRIPAEEVISGYSIQEYHYSTQHTDTISALTAMLDTLTILVIEPEDPQKPCYLATLPDELLLNILLQISLSSLASIASVSLVCKKLLSLAHGENSLYKTLCYYYFRPFVPTSALHARLSEFGGDWQRMLIERPRLRFDGCYIATCHYLRPGVNEYSWNTPIHMVTYFRFIRIYPDRSCITVLTTAEPREVVHKVSWSGTQAGLKGASEGVWRMTESGGVSLEVSGPKGYTFCLELQIKSTGRGKHNKLVWVGFHSVNREDGEQTVFKFEIGEG